MRIKLALTAYRLILPLLFITAFPGWLVKMLRRGGMGTHLGERVTVYTTPLEYELCHAVHIHAVSVGETLLALKLIREWRLSEPLRDFVLATGTATGHAVATSAKILRLRVTYAPLDLSLMVNRYLNRFEPEQVILIEGEVWPHLLLACHARHIPVRVVNARVSPRSARRFTRFANWLRPIYSLLDGVTLQEAADAEIWQTLGVDHQKIHLTGSLKFDPGSGEHPKRRPDFQKILDHFGKERPVILAASTHAGEDVFIAHAAHETAPHALIILVPRHAERRAEVAASLEKAGFVVKLRSSSETLVSAVNERCVLVVDSTGELSDWTAHADVVIIGKSFLSSGGQNPCEAILAEKPIITGAHMENFQPLTNRLVAAGACIVAGDSAALSQAIRTALDPKRAEQMTRQATSTLAMHHGATRRILQFLQHQKPTKF